jgi:hypothetical protein
MNSVVRIPQGDDTVKIELTVKEVMALAGFKFNDNHHIEVSARKKLNHALDGQYQFEDKRAMN